MTDLRKYVSTVLCIEDDPNYQEIVADALQGKAGALLDDLGVGPVELVFADTSSEGERLLREADRELKPYDVLLLDLGLPYAAGEAADPSEGKRLLGLVQSELKQACNCVVVQTDYTGFEHVRDVIRKGVADYLDKPFEPSDVRAAVAGASRRSQDSLALKWSELQRQQRQKWILSQACYRVADSLMSTVSTAMAAVQDQCGAVQQTIQEEFRYDFVRDHDEPICRQVIGLSEAANNVTKQCSDHRPQVHGQSDEVESIALSETVAAILRELGAGIRHKRLRVNFSSDVGPVVCSYRRDVEAIIREVAFGAIDSAPFGSQLEIQLVRDSDIRGAVLKIVDDGQPLTELPKCSDAQPEFFPLPGRGVPEREWALSLVCRAVEGIGSGMIVDHQQDRNSVVLELRGMSDDADTGR